MATAIQMQQMQAMQESQGGGTEDLDALIWNLAVAISNVACAPFKRAMKIRQAYPEKKSKGWKPLATVLYEEEGLLAGWRGYLASGITFVSNDIYDGAMSGVDRFSSLASLAWFAPATAAVLCPLIAVEAARKCDLGQPLSSAKLDMTEEDLKKLQKYDGIWDVVCKMYDDRGFGGFYDGFLPICTKIWVNDAHLLMWMVISELFAGESSLLDSLMSLGFVFGGELVSYPLDLIATRQVLLSRDELTFTERANSIYEKDGILGFYTGFLSYDYFLGHFSDTICTGVLAFFLSVAAEVSQ